MWGLIARGDVCELRLKRSGWPFIGAQSGHFMGHIAAASAGGASGNAHSSVQSAIAPSLTPSQPQRAWSLFR
jgi:outer membrane lipoprotein SlyB